MTLLLEDRALLAGFRRGDNAALVRVYRACAPPVARSLSKGFWCRAASGTQRVRLDPAELPAALQETFVRAFAPSARQRYDGLRPFLPFLQAMSRLAAIDVLRSRRRLSADAVALDDEAVGPELRAQGPDPERAALDRELSRKVQQFLGQLGEQDARLAQVRFVEGVSQEDSARRLGLSRQQLRTRERDLREAFASHLRQVGWLS